MKIVIYEDNFYDLKNTTKCIDDFFKSKFIEYELTTFENSDDLLMNISKYDLCFLDIELDTENGIDIGLKIRKYNKDIRIIIVSNYSKYLIDGYKIHADRYFIKPINQMEFNIELEIILENYLDKYIGLIDYKISKDKIYFNDILYIEFFDRKTFVFFVNGKKISTQYSLKKWNVLTGKLSFAQPHKSYLVNLKHISAFDNTNVIMIDSSTIPLSRHFKKSFEDRYMSSLHKR